MPRLASAWNLEYATLRRIQVLTGKVQDLLCATLFGFFLKGDLT